MCGCGNNYLQTMTGLMIGIGNRLRSKTGGRGHSPSSPSPSSLVGTTEHLPPRVTRKSSVKRKGAEIHGTAVKRCVSGCGVGDVGVTWLSWQLFFSGWPSSVVPLILPPPTHTHCSLHSEIARNVKPFSAAGDTQTRRSPAPQDTKATIRSSTHPSCQG